MRRKAIIIGAAGRDFHSFNTFFRGNENYEVVCFTAAQIPGIAERKYPPSLAGAQYPGGIPIHPEENLEKLITENKIDVAVFSYSDVSYAHVMHVASRAMAAGASFMLPGPNDTMIKSSKKVLAVCATRTGAGKSPLSKLLTKTFGKKLAVIRHPMPYGDLEKQAVQRFKTLKDLDKHDCTIEEREEYEGHIKNGAALFAGVDYQKILAEAEKGADFILWDGGNNDFPFYQPDLMVTVADALRPGHEMQYYPGEVNLRMADIILISKHSQNPEGAKQIEENAKKANPKAKIFKADLELTIDADIGGKKVLIVEDGPTVTHGGMPYGAGYLIAKREGAEILDPRTYAKGSIKQTYEKYSHMKEVLPAMGYGKEQMKELEETINASPAEIVVTGTPIDLSFSIKTEKPIAHVKYTYRESEIAPLIEEIRGRLGI